MKKSSYQKLKAENEKLWQTLRLLVMDPESEAAVFRRIELQAKFEADRIFWSEMSDLIQANIINLKSDQR